MEFHLWILNARNLKMNLKKLLKYGISTHLGFNHYLTYTEIQEALWKKPGQ